MAVMGLVMLVIKVIQLVLINVRWNMMIDVKVASEMVLIELRGNGVAVLEGMFSLRMITLTLRNKMVPMGVVIVIQM